MLHHPAWAVGSYETSCQLPELLELSQREVFTILMGHPVRVWWRVIDEKQKGERES